MKQFAYKAYDDQGLKQSGELYAIDLEQARKDLDGRNLAIVELEERSEEAQGDEGGGEQAVGCLQNSA